MPRTKDRKSILLLPSRDHFSVSQLQVVSFWAFLSKVCGLYIIKHKTHSKKMLGNVIIIIAVHYILNFLVYKEMHLSSRIKIKGISGIFKITVTRQLPTQIKQMSLRPPDNIQTQ